MPHAALCVSGPNLWIILYHLMIVSMPHAALCVSGLPSLDRELLLASCFNAARGIMCVGTMFLERKRIQMFGFNAARGIMCVGTPNYGNNMMGGSYVSMPHAALCVSGHPKFDTERPTLVEFQCRTRHYVCRDSPIQHHTLGSLCFNAARGIMCVGTTSMIVQEEEQIMFQCRTRHYVCRDSVSRSPCPARAEKAFWKDETVECGFAPVPEHSPFPSPL